MGRVSAGRVLAYFVTCFILIWKSDVIAWAITKSYGAFLEYLVVQLDWFASAKPAGGWTRKTCNYHFSRIRV